MPIPTECPDCLAEWQIPDKLAGKTVKCPECSGHMRVPGGDYPDPEEPSRHSATRPAKKPLRSYDDDDSPRCGKSVRSRGLSSFVVPGIVIGSLLLVGVIAAVIHSNSRKTRFGGDSIAFDQRAPGAGGPTPTINLPLPGLSGTVRTVAPARPALPGGWVEFHHPSGLFSAYVPSKPLLLRHGIDLSRRPSGDDLEVEEEYAPMPDFERATAYAMLIGKGNPRKLEAMMTQHGQAANPLPGAMMKANPITWSGRTAMELTVELDAGAMMGAAPGAPNNSMPKKIKTYLRTTTVKDKVVIFSVGDMKGTLTDAERSSFFDSAVFAP